MKTVIVALAAVVSFSSCYSAREIQVNMVNAELVRIDTIYRQFENRQVLTWKTRDNLEYVSYAPLDRVYTVGAQIAVMVKR